MAFLATVIVVSKYSYKMQACIKSRAQLICELFNKIFKSVKIAVNLSNQGGAVKFFLPGRCWGNFAGQAGQAFKEGLYKLGKG